MSTTPDTASGAGILAELRRAVRDFGFPVVVAGWLLYRDAVTSRDDRTERRELLTAIAKGLDEQTKALRDLSNAEREHARAVASLVPRVRLPEIP